MRIGDTEDLSDSQHVVTPYVREYGWPSCVIINVPRCCNQSITVHKCSQLMDLGKLQTLVEADRFKSSQGTTQAIPSRRVHPKGRCGMLCVPPPFLRPEQVSKLLKDRKVTRLWSFVLVTLHPPKCFGCHLGGHKVANTCSRVYTEYISKWET